jgi:hypothetical protein
MMRQEAHGSGSCDRRILKAFYTQYVAVLLIILVFTVGAFQRASQRDESTARPAMAPKEEVSIGGLQIAQHFDDLGQLGSDTAQLEAVALVIAEHDVKASIALPVSMQKIDPLHATVEQSLARVSSLERFFAERGVGEDSLELVIGGPDAREGILVVKFEGEDHDNFPL